MTTQPTTTRESKPAGPAAKAGAGVRGLHRLAIACGLPRDRVHEILHDWAVQRFGRASLTECTERELSQLRALILDGRRPESRSPVPGPRSRRGSGNGSMRMVTPRQRAFIAQLQSELGWTDEQRDAAIRKHLVAPDGRRIDGLAAVLTSAQAGKLITFMIGCNRQKSRALRRPRGRSPV